MALIELEWRQMGDVAQDRVFCKLPASEWFLIGYMGHGPNDPFNGLEVWHQLDSMSQEQIVGMIHDTKGSHRKIRIQPKTPEWFLRGENPPREPKPSDSSRSTQIWVPSGFGQ